MKIPLGILTVVALLLALMFVFAPAPDPELLKARSDLPWQVEARPGGNSRVFDLDLGQATLADAEEKFGAPEGLAVFEPETGSLGLEAFFGTVHFGPLKAKVIVALEASAGELAELKQLSAKREGSPSGDWKYTIDGPYTEHAPRRVTVLTYLPGTRGLDADFFRQRFGEPAAWLVLRETAVSWFYPELGLSILIDSEAGEALEYVAPRDFRLPARATQAQTDTDVSAPGPGGD